MDIIAAIGAFSVLGFLIWDRFFNKKEEKSDEELIRLKEERERLFQEKTRLESDFQNLNTKLGELNQQLKNVESERDKFAGANKQIVVENERIKGQIDSISKEKNELYKKLSDHESKREQLEKEQKDLVIKLEHAREKLEKEQARVIREDDEKRNKELEEQNRIWNEHEINVLAKLREACQKPEIGFSFYENNDLPACFDGKIKPDFLVDFLGQYIVFDAKCSKQKNPQSYINDQVKNTAKKYKDKAEIYPTIFFVVSQNEISNLKKYSFVEDGFLFYVISQEAIEPLLANFKKITEYENLENFDPQDREKIVNVISALDFHVNFQNAVNLVLTQRGVNVLKNTQNLDRETLEEVETKKKNMRLVNLTPTELKKFIFNINQQQEEVKGLISPKVEINEKELNDAKTLFDA